MLSLHTPLSILGLAAPQTGLAGRAATAAIDVGLICVAHAIFTGGRATDLVGAHAAQTIACFGAGQRIHAGRTLAATIDIGLAAIVNPVGTIGHRAGLVFATHAAAAIVIEYAVVAIAAGRTLRPAAIDVTLIAIFQAIIAGSRRRGIRHHGIRQQGIRHHDIRHHDIGIHVRHALIPAQPSGFTVKALVAANTVIAAVLIALRK